MIISHVFVVNIISLILIMILITANRLMQDHGLISLVTNSELGFNKLEACTYEAFGEYISNLVHSVKIYIELLFH
jgi:hypothetical protein